MSWLLCSLMLSSGASSSVLEDWCQASAKTGGVLLTKADKVSACPEHGGSEDGIGLPPSEGVLT